MKWADFLHADTNYLVGMLKNWGDFLDHGAIKSGVLLLHKSFHESRRLIEWFLHADSDWTIFGLTANLPCIFRRIPPEVFLGKGVLKICSKFTGEHPCPSAISIKSLGCSPVNLLHFFRTPFLKLLLLVLVMNEFHCHKFFFYLFDKNSQTTIIWYNYKINNL